MNIDTNATKALSRLKKIIKSINTRMKKQDVIDNKNTPILIFDKIANSKLGYEFIQNYKKNKKTSLIQRHRKKGYTISNILVGVSPGKGEPLLYTEKICPGCLLVKNISEFGIQKNKNKTIIPASRCKKCYSIEGKKRNQNKLRMIYNLFREQRRSSIIKMFPPPEYSLLWIQNWCLSSEKFNTLYEKWVESDHNTILKPSIDRINPLKHYKKDNIQVMTFGENSAKGRGIDRVIHILKNIEIIDDSCDISMLKSIEDVAKKIFTLHVEDSVRKKYSLDYNFEWLIHQVFKNKNIKKHIKNKMLNINLVNTIKIEKIHNHENYSKSNINITYNT